MEAAGNINVQKPLRSFLLTLASFRAVELSLLQSIAFRRFCSDRRSRGKSSLFRREIRSPRLSNGSISIITTPFGRQFHPVRRRGRNLTLDYCLVFVK
jgi:hypothetical protein